MSDHQFSLSLLMMPGFDCLQVLAPDSIHATSQYCLANDTIVHWRRASRLGLCLYAWRRKHAGLLSDRDARETP